MESVHTTLADILVEFDFLDENNVLKPLNSANTIKCCFCHIRNFRARINTPTFAAESEGLIKELAFNLDKIT